jgi:hypothetical protein
MKFARITVNPLQMRRELRQAAITREDTHSSRLLDLHHRRARDWAVAIVSYITAYEEGSHASWSAHVP